MENNYHHRLALFPVVVASILFLLSLFSPSPTLAIQETGGTDYATYYLGDYANNPTDENRPQVQAVLTHYHTNPNLVKTQLQDKCNHGQNKIGFILWFYPYAPTNAIAADSSTWHPSEQLKQNIKDVISLVKTQQDSKNNPCFNEIQFRFANTGSANPELWKIIKKTAKMILI